MSTTTTEDTFNPAAHTGPATDPAKPVLSDDEQAKADLLGVAIDKYLRTLTQGEKLAIKRRYEVKDFTDDADLVMIVCARQKGRGMDDRGPSWLTYEQMTDDEIVDFLIEGESAPGDDESPTPGVTTTPAES